MVGVGATQDGSGATGSKAKSHVAEVAASIWALWSGCVEADRAGNRAVCFQGSLGSERLILCFSRLASGSESNPLL